MRKWRIGVHTRARSVVGLRRRLRFQRDSCDCVGFNVTNAALVGVEIHGAVGG